MKHLLPQSLKGNKGNATTKDAGRQFITHSSTKQTEKGRGNNLRQQPVDNHGVKVFTTQ